MGRRPVAGPGYVPGIDGLRAVAVLSVIIFHIWPGVLPGGFTGVDIFFVISGFVVTGSLLGERFENRRELAQTFYARRLRRIMPALIAMLLVTLLAAQLFVPQGWLSESLPQVARFAFFGLSNVVLATDTDTYFGPQAEYNPFTHTWSLGVEEQFYLLFPFLLYGRSRVVGGGRAILTVGWLSLASLLLCVLLTALARKFAFYLVFSRFWELGAGMLLCLTRAQWQEWLDRKRAATPVVAGGGALIALGLMIAEGPLFPFPLALLPVIGTGMTIAAVCAQPLGAAQRLLASRPFVAIGRLSYSLYLWHWPVLALFRWTVGADTLALRLTILAITVLLSLLCFFLIEQPLRTSPRIRALTRARAVSVMVAATVTAALIGSGLIALHDRLSLSVTRNHADWYADEHHPLDPARSGCGVTADERPLQGGKVTLWSPTRCPTRFTLFVPADSHGLAYAPVLRQLVAELGVSVRLYFRPRCPYLKLTETLASRSNCNGYFAAIRTDITAARAGDLVFLPGLRVARLINQFEGDADLSRLAREHATLQSLDEAHGLLSSFARRQVGAVIEAPKPVLRSPAFRCSDWFNRANPICEAGLSVPRAEELAHRDEMMRAMRRLVATTPGLTLWDPFAMLCPGETCSAQRDGRPLFLDGDHLSGHANDLLYPSLRATLLAARARALDQPTP